MRSYNITHQIIKGMAKALTHDEKVAFINENRSLIPSKQVDWFDKQNVDKQYTKIRQYVRKASPATTRINVKSIVKQITSANPSVKQIEAIINGLNDWANSTTQRQIDEIDKQIEELNKKKKALVK